MYPSTNFNLRPSLPFLLPVKTGFKLKVVLWCVLTECHLLILPNTSMPCSRNCTSIPWRSMKHNAYQFMSQRRQPCEALGNQPTWSNMNKWENLGLLRSGCFETRSALPSQDLARIPARGIPGCRSKCVALTIQSQRLHAVRSARMNLGSQPCNHLQSLPFAALKFERSQQLFSSVWEADLSILSFWSRVLLLLRFVLWGIRMEHAHAHMVFAHARIHACIHACIHTNVPICI